MDWFLLIGVAVCQLIVAVAQKGYIKKVSNGGMSFSAMVIFFQIIFFTNFNVSVSIYFERKSSYVTNFSGRC